jgi:hypothetical protein
LEATINLTNKGATTMNKITATARPWQRGAFGKIYGVGDMPTMDGGLSHNEAVEICKVKNGCFGLYDVKPLDNAVANADLIVKCVNGYEGLESAYLSASDKVLKLGCQNEKILQANKALRIACEQAFLMLANVDALKCIDDGTEAGKNVDSKRMEVMERISQSLNATQR